MVLHLITQRGQPYGSVRRCCEMCGEYGKIGDGEHFWTDDPEAYRGSMAACICVPAELRGSSEDAP